MKKEGKSGEKKRRKTGKKEEKTGKKKEKPGKKKKRKTADTTPGEGQKFGHFLLF